MAAEFSLWTLVAGAALPVGLWFLDKIAGIYIDNKARRVICGDDNSPAADRIARTLTALEAEHDALKATTLAVIADRDRYLDLYLASQRELRQRSA